LASLGNKANSEDFEQQAPEPSAHEAEVVPSGCEDSIGGIAGPVSEVIAAYAIHFPARESRNRFARNRLPTHSNPAKSIITISQI
jgi:hypothetical protein